MSGKKKKILLSALIIAAVCAAVIIAVLVITLSGKNADKPHIKIEDGGVQTVSGELDISLKRVRLETVTLDKNGLPVRKTDGNLTDFSKSDKNIFGIDEDMLIGPKCYFSAQMTIENLKPYDFEYRLEIIPENGGNLLAEQIELTVEIDGEIFIKRTLNSGLETKVFPTVKSGKTAEFTVRLEYLDVVDNNETKNTTLAFDMIVHAKLTQS